MSNRFLATAIASAVGALASFGVVAQETAKVGLVLPLTGGLAPVGKQVEAGARLYMQQHGATVEGVKDPVKAAKK